MNAFTYRAIWEIADIDRPRSALIAEASAALDIMANRDGAMLTGDPSWLIADERLICEAPAERLPHPRPADRDAEILRLVGLRWTDKQIALVVGCAPSTVGKVRASAGIPSTYLRGGRLRPVDGDAA